MKTNPVYAVLELHGSRSVLGSMNEDGHWRGWSRFRTEPEELQRQVRALGPGVRLTLEASALTRWAVSLLRPLVEQLIVCEPRHNRLIATNTNSQAKLPKPA
jgi:hypothetical protein